MKKFFCLFIALFLILTPLFSCGIFIDSKNNNLNLLFETDNISHIQTNINATNFSMSENNQDTNNAENNNNSNENFDITEEEKDLKNEISDSVEEQLSILDLSAMSSFLKNFCEEQNTIFGSNNLIDKINQIISGEFSDGQTSLFSAICEMAFQELISFLPLMASIIAIAILSSLLMDLKGDSKSIGDIIHFVCYGLIIVIVGGFAIKMLTMTGDVLNLIVSQMEVVFPILLTLLTAMGGTVSVAVFQPSVVVLTSIVSAIFLNILMPIFIFSMVFAMISNLSSTIKIDKISGFLNSLFKWIIGIVFTIFMGYLAVKGITAGSIDSVSFKTARYSLSTYIPIIGGYLSEGLNVILASTLLIKNAIGTCGILILFASVILPILQLVLFVLCLKFVGAILQPLSDSRISNFITSVSKVFIMPIVMILAVSFMYLIFVALIMCTSVSF